MAPRSALPTPTIPARRQKSQASLGGTALVCRNLLELGASVRFITLVGNDDEARHIRSFSHPKLELVELVSTDKPTTVKQRFWIDGYRLLQLDVRDDRPISEDLEAALMAAVEAALPRVNLTVISDYRHGLLSDRLLPKFLATVRRPGKPVFVDSQVAQNESNHRLYRGDGVICLNLREARCIDPAFEPTRQAASFTTLVRELATRQIVVKLGEAGALALDGDRTWSAPAANVKVVDTTGAGDAFLSAYCLAHDRRRLRPRAGKCLGGPGGPDSRHGTARPRRPFGDDVLGSRRQRDVRIAQPPFQVGNGLVVPALAAVLYGPEHIEIRGAPPFDSAGTDIPGRETAELKAVGGIVRPGNNRRRQSDQQCQNEVSRRHVP
jgi:rfaE bifunctional protein kinase chain/domain